MKRLFVGCRVRILYSDGWPELAGEEGWIVGEGVIDFGPHAGKQGWMVAPDCWGTCTAPTESRNGGNGFCPISQQLEPILPEGMQPCEEGFEEWLDSMMTTDKEKVL